MSYNNGFVSASAMRQGQGQQQVPQAWNGQQAQVQAQQWGAAVAPQAVQQWHPSAGIPPGAQVSMFPTLAAASNMLQGCNIPTTDNTTYVPQTTVVKHIKNFQVVSYQLVQTQKPVTTATNVQVVQHPVQLVCAEAPAACEVAAPVCATGCSPGVGAVGPSVVLGNMSQTPFRF